MARSGLGLGSASIGLLQSVSGAGNILLALLATYRIIQALGPPRTFALSLFLNGFAAFAPSLVQLLWPDISISLAMWIMGGGYVLVAASRNMLFATALLLSTESAR